MKFLVKPLLLLTVAVTTVTGAKAIGEAVRSESLIQHNDFRAEILNDVERVQDWTVYRELPAVKIEYKFEACDSHSDMGYNNTNVILLRFTNLTKNKIQVSWANELHFDGECVNCDKLEDPEYKNVLILKSKEVKEGDCFNRDRTVTIAADFIKLYPGMSGTKLTDFSLANLEVTIIK